MASPAPCGGGRTCPALGWLLDATTTFKAAPMRLVSERGKCPHGGARAGPAPLLPQQPGPGLAVTASGGEYPHCTRISGMGMPPQHSLAFPLGRAGGQCTGEGRDSHSQHTGSSICGSPSCPTFPLLPTWGSMSKIATLSCWWILCTVSNLVPNMFPW